ncbi:MAG: division/cell wall cluster transcriptional repressor MraZ [Propionibacteriaceae bacterium]|nr:division/cell wall cluster transcriptional repressor MraZ [Propionibacteriaceae bacterium]
MFLGTYTPKFDEKGRFFLPPKFRDELATGLVVVRGQERCLAIYTTDAFVGMIEKVTAPGTIKQVRDYKRMLGAGASDSAPDKQGRVSIPANLRSWANLDRDLVVTGAIDHVELWNPELWEQYEQEQTSPFAELNGEIGV